MNCPRCGLFNPPEAQRCDCGFDFTKGTVEKAYFRQAMPKGLKSILIIVILYNLIGGFVALNLGNPITMVLVILYIFMLWFFYAMVVTKHYWAYIALIVTTLPFVLLLVNTREMRLYCLQNK